PEPARGLVGGVAAHFPPFSEEGGTVLFFHIRPQAVEPLAGPIAQIAVAPKLKFTAGDLGEGQLASNEPVVPDRAHSPGVEKRLLAKQPVLVARSPSKTAAFGQAAEGDITTLVWVEQPRRAL